MESNNKLGQKNISLYKTSYRLKIIRKKKTIVCYHFLIRDYTLDEVVAIRDKILQSDDMEKMAKSINPNIKYKHILNDIYEYRIMIIEDNRAIVHKSYSPQDNTLKQVLEIRNEIYKDLNITL